MYTNGSVWSVLEVYAGKPRVTTFLNLNRQFSKVYESQSEI
jgi:hypothetical protein